MNKKIRSVIMFTAIALVAGINVYHSRKTVDMSDVALANVEALANDEGTDSDCYIYCEPDNRYSCYISWGAGIDGVACHEMRKR